MEKQILYLKEEGFVTTKVTNIGAEEIYSIRSEIERLSKTHLFSFSVYKKMVRKQIGLKNKIPIYFSKSLFMFYVRVNGSKYLINYSNILKICYLDGIIIIFKNGEILKLSTKKKIIEKEISKIMAIEEYMLNLDL